MREQEYRWCVGCGVLIDARPGLLLGCVRRRLLQERRLATSSATRSVPRPSERVLDGLEQGVQIEWLRQRVDAELAEHLLVLMQRVDDRGADDHRDGSCCRIERQQVQDRPAVLFAADADVLNEEIRSRIRSRKSVSSLTTAIRARRAESPIERRSYPLLTTGELAGADGWRGHRGCPQRRSYRTRRFTVLTACCICL